MATTKGVHYVSYDDEQIKSTGVNRQAKNDLDKNAFMQLLVTQLRYQDPLDPMDNQAFMAQMAQFSALEHMMNMSQSMEQSNTHALIGKVIEASYKDPASNQLEIIAGKVDGVVIRNNQHFLLVDGKEIELKNVQNIIDPSLINSTNINSGFELIGKTVQAFIIDKETGKKLIYEGQVQEIVMENSNPHVVIGNGEQAAVIPVDNVQNVIEQPTITDKYARGTIVDDEGNTIDIEGIVEYLLVIDGEIQVSINDILVPFNQIKSVSKNNV